MWKDDKLECLSGKILESLPVGVVILDSEKKIHYINNEALKMIKADEATSINGSVCHNFICPHSAGKCPVLDENKEIDFSEKILLDINGNPAPIIKSVKVFEHDGERLLLEAFFDIKQRKLEEEREWMKKTRDEIDKLKKEFIMNMSHELRTPANVLLGMLDLAMKEDISEEAKEMLYTARESGERLVQAVEDILDVALLESGLMEEKARLFNLNELVNSVLSDTKMTDRQKAVKVVCVMPSETPETLNGRCDILRKILLHLIENALKFTREGAVELNIKIKEHPPGTQRVLLLFKIKDSGVGIPEEKREIIFDLFSQGDSSRSRSYEGLGLGLTIASKLVRAAGGEIWLDSSGPKGSCFCFTFNVEIAERSGS